MYGLSQALMDAIGTAYKPQQGQSNPLMAQPASQQAQPKMGKGQLIAGILGDALSGALGQQGQFAATMRQRQAAEQEEAQWTRRQQSELGQYGQKKQIDQQYGGTDLSPIERDARAWMGMGPELQAAYRAAQAARPQFIPDGMGGGQWAIPPAAGASPQPMKTAPRGKLTPVAGGPTPPASGAFPR